jgi:hypothetical protein
MVLTKTTQSGRGSVANGTLTITKSITIDGVGSITTQALH